MGEAYLSLALLPRILGIFFPDLANPLHLVFRAGSLLTVVLGQCDQMGSKGATNDFGVGAKHTILFDEIFREDIRCLPVPNCTNRFAR